MTQPPFPYRRIFVSGHRGMVGTAIVRQLRQFEGLTLLTRTRDQLDLCDQSAVRQFFERERPDAVLFAAAKVGGIHANATYPAEFGYQNVMMAANAIEAAYQNGVQRFVYLGSTCIYPRMAPQPIQEESLLTRPLEQTNEAYGLAKIMGLKLCQYYRQQYGVTYHSAMPTNLYGPGDNYHPENAHVIPCLIQRFHAAKEQQQPTVAIWGTGTPRREFLHVDDLASALVHLMQLADPPDWINVGTGKDLTIQELAQRIANVVGYEGELENDLSRPDGTPVKRTDITKLAATGWQPRIDFDRGLEATYRDFLASLEHQTLRTS